MPAEVERDHKDRAISRKPRVLVTGGGGYVGSVLVPELLKRRFKVRVVDSLRHGGQGLVPCFIDRRFEYIRGDIRDVRCLREALKSVDYIIHLAAIVGFPACKKYPDLARAVNVQGTRLLVKLRSKSVPILFASTGSNYGAVPGQLCTEETPLRPISLYGETKSRAEQYLFDAGNATCFRFATAFGASARMRLDLLINDFVYQAVRNRNLIIYEKSFKRTFIHVRDMARSFLFALEHYDSMKDEAYNVGSETMNYSKEDIALLISKRVQYYLHFAEIGHDEDQRDYEVSYQKIRALGFHPHVSLEQGIDELVKVAQVLDIHNVYSNI